MINIIVMTLSFWIGIIACYIIEWYLDVYGYPWEKKIEYKGEEMPMNCRHLKITK